MTGEGEDWKNKTGDRGGWKRPADEAVKKLQAAPHPLIKRKNKKGGRIIYSVVVPNIFPVSRFALVSGLRV